MWLSSDIWVAHLSYSCQLKWIQSIRAKCIFNASCYLEGKQQQKPMAFLPISSSHDALPINCLCGSALFLIDNKASVCSRINAERAGWSVWWEAVWMLCVVEFVDTSCFTQSCFGATERPCNERVRGPFSFSNNRCLPHAFVLHFGDSCNIFNWVIVTTSIMVIGDRWSLMLFFVLECIDPTYVRQT
jgi:hypothetical protein